MKKKKHNDDDVDELMAGRELKCCLACFAEPTGIVFHCRMHAFPVTRTCTYTKNTPCLQACRRPSYEQSVSAMHTLHLLALLLASA